MLVDGFTHLIDPPELDALLAEGRPLRVKAGFDPTSPDIHLGHVVLLRKLRQFQDEGHTVVMIVGTTTASIGDPTGRNQMRLPLSSGEIEANAETYMTQAFKILDPMRTVIRRNSEWFNSFSITDVISMMSNFTLSQVMIRDEFRSRQEKMTPIFMHELLYPMLQAYDSFREGVDIELGGNDQFYNLMMGREFMRMRGEKPQIIGTVPILVGLDGIEKMSKSKDNYIGVNDEPFEMYSKAMSISDKTMNKWIDILFPVWVDRSESPMQMKKRLAGRIVELLHTDLEAFEAERVWIKTFSEKQIPVDMPTVTLSLSDLSVGLRLDKLLRTVGLASSVSEAGRLMKAKAVRVNGCITTDLMLDPTTQEFVIQVGRKWMKITQE